MVDELEAQRSGSAQASASGFRETAEKSQSGDMTLEIGSGIYVYNRLTRSRI